MKQKTTKDGSASLTELRRGVLVLGILSRLPEPHYGYSLRVQLAEHGLVVNEGTLYPLLRRLESQGLLNSEWRVGEDRPRRYYRLSEKGRTHLARLTAEWRDMVTTMDRLLDDSA